MDPEVSEDSKSAEHDASSSNSSSLSSAKKKNKKKPGIIYLSSVPDFMNVQKLRQRFEEYGEVDRLFFQPVEKSFNFKKGLLFTEGWVEFRRKSVAKLVARVMNNTKVGGKRRHSWYNCIWNIKYLPKFVWTDVNADKQLKRQTHDSRIRTEITQAKKQTNFYAANMEKGATLDRINLKRDIKGKGRSDTQIVRVTQRLTDEEFLEKKKRRREKQEDRTDKKKIKLIEENDKKHKFVMSSIFG